MARKLIVPETENKTNKLFDLIANWGENKSTADKLKKVVDADAAEIKQIMIQEGLENKSSGKYTACLSFQNKETFDEVGILNYIKSKLWGDKGSMHCPYIKTVEVINWDALEKAIYNGEITKEQILEIDKFKTVTKTPVLKLKVDKEK